MTEARLRRLCRLWQGRLGLSFVEIDVVVRSLEDDRKAEADLSKNYDYAQITFAPWLLGKGEPPEAIVDAEISDDGVEQTLVHELLHVVLKRYRRVWTAIEDQIHPDAWALFEDQMNAAEEETVDRLAVALKRHWP